MIPESVLDTVEVEGGLTWRQATLLGLTQGYLRIPGDETAESPYADARLGVRRAVSDASKTFVPEGGVPTSAKEVVVFCLGVAVEEYSKLCEFAPEWTGDKRLVNDLLALWQEESVPYMTETLASNVLYRMYNQ